MSKKPDNALRLLIVDDSVEDAEAVVSALRNDGIAVRPLRPANAEEMAAMLAEQPVDLVLADPAAATVELAEVARLVTSSAKDIPLVVLAEELDDAEVARFFATGARRVALRGEPAQLLRSLRLEWDDLESRRALRRLDAQVRETERRCDALIESSRDPIAYVHEGMHIRANPAYLEMFGFDEFADMEGMSLLDLVAAQHVADFKQLLKSLSKGEAPPPRYQLLARDSAGTSFPATMEFTPATYEGEACLQVIFRRRESDPELAREVEELRQRDQATGLFNRQTFLRALEEAVADAGQHGGQHALLLVEPDHYQRLLQSIGLDASDAIVTAFSGMVADALDGNSDAVIGRFGEHTLGVLLKGADHPTTVAAAERICASARRVMSIGTHSSAVSASIGGVQIGERNAGIPQILAKAHEGLQSAMGVGGNRFEIFDPSATDRAEQERVQAWIERLRAALASGDFVLHYQPVIGLQGDVDPMYESLVRLHGGNDEPLPPGTFLAIAEEHGLLAPIDRWVAGRAIRMLARERTGKPVTLMTKVSPASLADDALARYLQASLREHRLPGSRLVLQLSESKVFSHLESARAFRANVRDLGCGVCLEHFGVGLDSFQLLEHLQPDLLKIDRSLVEDLPRNSDNQARVQEIARRAKQAGVRTIAEFVQDAASMAILFTCGIDLVQGNFLAPAGPEMDYEFDA